MWCPEQEFQLLLKSRPWTSGGGFSLDSNLFPWFERLRSHARRITLGGLSLLLVFLLYPFQTTVVPVWSLQVVDEQGASVADVNVTEHWQHNSLETTGHEETLRTDAGGQVSFSSRTLRASILTRTLAPALKFLGQGRRAKFGSYASVVVWGSTDIETTVAIYERGEKPPARVVAARVR